MKAKVKSEDLTPSEKMFDWFMKKSGLVNRTWWNRRHWKNYLKREGQGAEGVVGFDWGDPESEKDYYGNYKEVLRRLQSNIDDQTHLVEIGSYGGKWTQYMGRARLVTCVDLFEESFAFLKERLGAAVTLDFYKTAGDELIGIPRESCDLVFSMDSFVRMTQKATRRYFFEMARVLKQGGKILIHLPANEIPFCRRKRFTNISSHWIRKTAARAGFQNIHLDFSVLKHGVLLEANK